MPYASTAVVGYIHAPIGIGESARRQVRALRAINHRTTAHAVGFPNLPFLDFPGVSDGPPPAHTDIIAHLNPPSLIPPNPLHALYRNGQNYLIGYWHWELPVFPMAWMEALDLVHEIWVPTRFCADAYDGCKRPVRIVPHPVPLNTTPKNLAREALGLPQDRFIFLSISETGSFPVRKNPAGAARAFVDAFSDRAGPAPLLVLKIHGTGNRPPEFERFLAEMHEHPLVHVIDQTVPDKTIRDLQAACDCFVSLHRSEGFGFNIAESMAAGRVAIATNFSGNVDFMTPDNSIPIPYAVRLVQPGDYPDGNGQYWAEPDHDAAVEAMRWVVDNPDAAAALGQRAQADMAANHSFEHVGRQVAATLKRAGAAHRAPRAEPMATKPLAPLAPPSGNRFVADTPVSRNAPCPCGSGKRYKHCHGR